MSPARRFPTWSESLACFYCGALLVDAPEQDKEYADGDGRYRRTCSNCGRHTYYDRAEETNA